MNFTCVLTATVEGGQLGEQDRHSSRVPWWSLTKTALAAGALAAGGRLALDPDVLIPAVLSHRFALLYTWHIRS